MKKILSKSPRQKLDSDSYTALHRQVLERDNWRCQACGSMQNLEVHHIHLRSHGGPDIEHNLITLCERCHRIAHHCRENCYGLTSAVPSDGWCVRNA